MPSYYIPSDAKRVQLNDIMNNLKEDIKNSISEISFINDEIVITINKLDLVEVIYTLKDEYKYSFRQLIDITAVDYPQRDQRFEVVYFLLSLTHNIRIRLKVCIAENELIDSLTTQYSNADWLEREVYDMFGIYFRGHKDLRRLLTDFGFDGSPLRKDFPLTGFVELEFDSEQQKIVYKPVELNQAYRDYAYRSPWMENIEADTFAYLNKQENIKKDS